MSTKATLALLLVLFSLVTLSHLSAADDEWDKMKIIEQHRLKDFRGGIYFQPKSVGVPCFLLVLQGEGQRGLHLIILTFGM